jgi:hypothetical protein
MAKTAADANRKLSEPLSIVREGRKSALGDACLAGRNGLPKET